MRNDQYKSLSKERLANIRRKKLLNDRRLADIYARKEIRKRNKRWRKKLNKAIRRRDRKAIKQQMLVKMGTEENDPNQEYRWLVNDYLMELGHYSAESNDEDNGKYQTEEQDEYEFAIQAEEYISHSTNTMTTTTATINSNTNNNEHSYSKASQMGKQINILRNRINNPNLLNQSNKITSNTQGQTIEGQENKLNSTPTVDQLCKGVSGIKLDAKENDELHTSHVHTADRRH